MSFNTQSKRDVVNTRFFPRTETECPILYAIGNSTRWRVARMVNISATGLLMICNEPLLRNISITVKTKPGLNRLVPSFTGKGKVTRCDTLDKDKAQFQISCKLSKITPSSK